VRVRRVFALAALAVAVLAAGSSAATQPGDRALVALDVLPPGQTSNDPHLRDQIPLYDGLTPLQGKVTTADLRRLYKPEPLGLGAEKPVSTERPRRGVTIERDRFGVPHVVGTSRANTEFGAGWATAEDRGLDLQLLRGPARLAALDVPGYDAFSIALSARTFVPSAQTEAFLAAQATLAQATAQGRQVLRDVDACLAGINAYFALHGGSVARFTRNDVVAIASLIGAVFGAGGGNEARSAQFLSDLQARLGQAKGLGVWNDLREQDDADAPVTIDGRFPYESGPSGIGSGNVPIDTGSFEPFVAGGGGAQQPHVRGLMSNALLLGASRSTNRHPIFVAGPQVGYFAPEILMEEDLHGGGLDARGVAFPGLGFYIQIGRGPDYAWSATSASSDVIDEFAETLCGNGTTQYEYKGACRDMGTFDAGTLEGRAGAPSTELTYRTTVHGPVVGYATSNGKPVAVSLDRSTRGRELLNAYAFQTLSTGGVRSPADFVKTMSTFELTFNWFYADSRHIAMYSSGRLPLRASDVNPGLPANGDGSHDWRGFLAPSKHPFVVDPPSGAIVNWNNRPAAGFGAADDNWTYGAVHRVQLLNLALPKPRTTPAGVVAAMNTAATQDLRATLVPILAKTMARVPAPSARDAQMLQLVQAWNGSRLDADLDGKIDAPGAAIMDTWWPRLAVAVMRPVLGTLTDELQTFNPLSNDANAGGSSFGAGWYGYVQKDIQALVAAPIGKGFANRYCGAGDVVACAASLWQSLDAAGDVLAAAQGADPRAWRADASAERIRFNGFIGDTMRWTNRPTFQQVIQFASHR
jgi:acyl-homoserine lactone acylase PvdQ